VSPSNGGLMGRDMIKKVFLAIFWQRCDGLLVFFFRVFLAIFWLFSGHSTCRVDLLQLLVCFQCIKLASAMSNAIPGRPGPPRGGGGPRAPAQSAV